MIPQIKRTVASGMPFLVGVASCRFPGGMFIDLLISTRLDRAR